MLKLSNLAKNVDYLKWLLLLYITNWYFVKLSKMKFSTVISFNKLFLWKWHAKYQRRSHTWRLGGSWTHVITICIILNFYWEAKWRAKKCYLFYKRLSISTNIRFTGCNFFSRAISPKSLAYLDPPLKYYGMISSSFNLSSRC